MNKLIFALVMFVASTSAYAQFAQASINFEKKIHDFGTIKESDGKVSYVFKFKNAGNQALVVHNVKASCGCTTPEWTRTPILPGKEGNIKATFDPKNRPGNFNKSITVYSNGQDENVILRITGVVSEKEKTVEDLYSSNMDKIRLESSHLALTKISPSEVKTEELKIISTSDSDVKIGFDNVPAHIKISAVPEVLKPGQKGVIKATYDAKAKNDWGFLVDNVYLRFNDEKNYKNRLTVSATIQEDFSNLTSEQLAAAAKVEIKEKTWNFGEIKQGDVVNHDFVIKNVGKSQLMIRKVKASCGCTATKPQKTALAPGESTTISTTFNSKGKSGRQNKSVTVVTNDPKLTSVMLRITGNITME